jgi:hypothetical protein
MGERDCPNCCGSTTPRPAWVLVPGGWPGLLTRTLTTGGDGYCLHATLQARPDTRDLLRVVRRIGDRCGPAIPAADDFVHYDFTPANLLTNGAAITGVIDINPPVLASDRAFDLATLLFYLYDHDDIRDLLRARLLEQGGPRLPRAHGAAPGRRVAAPPSDRSATQRHLGLARLVTADIDHRPVY